MTELTVSPLARRIAEENNVDWRALAGSDAEGDITERDVLNYLEGVMLGTQPVDPTPEPLPEGMTTWRDLEATAQSPWTARATFVDTAPAANPVAPATKAEAAPPELSTSADVEEGLDEDVEAVYRELFAELGALKTAAAAAEGERRKECEAAQQLRLELARVREALATRETELTALRAHIAELETDRKTLQQGADAAQLELKGLRETVSAQDEALVQAQALKVQLATLRAQLSTSEAQAEELQNLGERFARADTELRKAQSEAEQLRAVNTGLERTLAELKAAPKTDAPKTAKRPWWKLWG